MTGSSAYLTLFPERCDDCGACRGVCPNSALKVGPQFIYVDWRRCDGCRACVEVCDRNAIVSRTVPLRSTGAPTTVPLSEVSKVVVGSRAEAKAVRKAAEQAAKGKKPGKVAPAAPPKPSRRAEKAAGLAAQRPSEWGADAASVVDGIGTDPGAAAASTADPEPASDYARTSADRRASSASRPSLALPSLPAIPPLAADSGSPTQWTLVDAGAVLGIALAALLAKNAVLGLQQVSLMPMLGQTVVRIAVLVVFYVAQFAAFGWLAARHGRPALEALGLRRRADGAGPEAKRPSTAGSAGLVVGLAIGYEAITVAYGLAMKAAGSPPPPMLSSDLTHVFGTGPVGLAFAALLVAIAAPFAEEIAFRGIVLPALGDRWGAWVGIGGSAVLFAAYHMQPWLALPMLIFGAILGWLTWTRRSLWPAIALHVLCNALSVFAAFAGPR